MSDKIEKTIPGYPNLDAAKVEAELNTEFLSLMSGYDTAKSERIRFYREYKFQPYGNEVQGQSKMTDSTIFDAIEWMTPTLIQPFIDTDDFVKIAPEGANIRDLVVAGVTRELLNYQMRKKNPWYQVMHDTIKGFLIQGQSYMKVTWVKKNKKENEPVSRPKLEAIPAYQIRYDWTIQNFADSRVVCQEEDMSRSDIVELMNDAPGLMKERFDKVLAEPGSNTRTGRLREEQNDQPNWVGEDLTKKNIDDTLYLRREQWTDYDLDGDGIAEPIMAVFLGDTLVQMIENPFPFKRPPYLAAQCVRDVLGNPAISWSCVLSDIQRFKTGIMRLMSDNLNSQQNGLYEVDRTNIDEVGMLLLQNAPQGTRIPIPVRKPGTINPLTPTPIAGHAFTTWELLSVAAENRSGFTRYSQGLDSKSLNQTATGIISITQRSEMRMWELAQRLGEMVLKPLTHMLISMNQKFLEKQDLELQFGLPGFQIGEINIPEKKAGEWISLGKEDIGGFFTVTIDIQVASDKQQQIDNYLQWAQFFGPFTQQSKVLGDAMTIVGLETAKLMGLQKIELLARKELKDEIIGTRGVSVPTGPIEEVAGMGEEAIGVPGAVGAEVPETAGIPGVQGADLGELLGGIPEEATVGDVGAPV